MIGCGQFSRRSYGPAFLKLSKQNLDIKLVGCLSRTAENARSFQESFGFYESYVDLEAMVRNARPDLVFLVTSPEVTPEIAEKLIHWGIPLSIEKPPAPTTEKISYLTSLVESHNVIHQVAYNRRFYPLVQHFRTIFNKICKNEFIHQITYRIVRVNRCDRDFSRTGLLAIDMVRYLSGASYEKLKFHYQAFPNKGEGVANIYIDGEIKNGTMVQISLLPLGGGIFEHVEITLNNHSFLLRLPWWNGMDNPVSLSHYTGNELVDVVKSNDLVQGDADFATICGFTGEIKSFIEHVDKGQQPENSLRSAIEVGAITDQIRSRASSYLGA